MWGGPNELQKRGDEIDEPGQGVVDCRSQLITQWFQAVRRVMTPVQPYRDIRSAVAGRLQAACLGEYPPYRSRGQQ